MSRTLATLAALVCLAGCGDKPTAKQQPAAGGSPAPQQAFSAPPVPITPPPIAYQGQTPAQWGAHLLGRDPQRRQEAGKALQQLQEQGTPYLLQGLRSASDITRLISIEALPMTEMVRREKETFPLLVQMLGDRNPAIRQQAAGRLAWFGKNARVALDALRQVAENDPHPDVRAAARGSLTDINDSINGKKRPES